MPPAPDILVVPKPLLVPTCPFAFNPGSGLGQSAQQLTCLHMLLHLLDLLHSGQPIPPANRAVVLVGLSAPQLVITTAHVGPVFARSGLPVPPAG